MFLEAFPSKSHLELSQVKPMEIRERERGGWGGGVGILGALALIV